MKNATSKRIRKESKKILSVSIRRIVDESPETSWLGEYSNSPSSVFSIDRKHSEDCASVQRFDSVGDEWSTWNGTVEELISRVIERADDFTEEEFPDLNETFDCLYDLRKETECDCNGGDMGRHEHRFFNPSFNYVGKGGSPEDCLTPEDVRKYTRQDYERMESLNRGDWCFIGVTAEAEIGIPSGYGGTNYTVQRIHSGGLWGIESDSEDSFIESEERNQLADLKDQLRALGFSARAISKAFEEVKRAD